MTTAVQEARLANRGHRPGDLKVRQIEAERRQLGRNKEHGVRGGRHLWVDADFSETRWFLSDELGKRVIKAKLKKLDLVRHRLGRR